MTFHAFLAPLVNALLIVVSGVISFFTARTNFPEGIVSTSNSNMEQDSVFDGYKVAALLRRLPLPADLIPAILDFADFTHRIPGAECSDHFRISQHQSGRIYIATRLSKVYPIALRAIHFTTTSRDQGYSWDTNNHGTYNGSWTWFDAGTLEDHQFNGEFNFLPSTRIAGKKICHNVHAGREYKTHTITWRIDDPDEFIKAAFREVKSGKPIAVAVCAQFPAWVNDIQHAKIEFDIQPVRKV